MNLAMHSIAYMYVDPFYRYGRTFVKLVTLEHEATYGVIIKVGSRIVPLDLVGE